MAVPLNEGDLRVENETLRERIAQLEGILFDRHKSPPEWGLTKSEDRVFGVLLSREIATLEAIATALYGDRLDDWPGDEICRVFIHRMRSKLLPHDVVINTVWGRGYHLDARTKAKFKVQRGGADAPRARDPFAAFQSDALEAAHG
jgi:hypothetical protein